MLNEYFLEHELETTFKHFKQQWSEVITKEISMFFQHFGKFILFYCLSIRTARKCFIYLYKNM